MIDIVLAKNMTCGEAMYVRTSDTKPCSNRGGITNGMIIRRKNLNLDRKWPINVFCERHYE
jgi:hypothetical protein